MRLVFAAAIAALFGTGAYLLLRRDLVRVVIGFLLISQSAVLTLIASGIGRGNAPIYPLPDGEITVLAIAVFGASTLLRRGRLW